MLDRIDRAVIIIFKFLRVIKKCTEKAQKGRFHAKMDTIISDDFEMTTRASQQKLIFIGNLSTMNTC